MNPEAQSSPETLDSDEIYQACNTLFEKSIARAKLDPSRVISLRWELAAADSKRTEVRRDPNNHKDLAVKISRTKARDGFKLLITEGTRLKEVPTNLGGWREQETMLTGRALPDGFRREDSDKMGPDEIDKIVSLLGEVGEVARTVRAKTVLGSLD